MRILYHQPNPHTISAARTIFYGYKNAFEDSGHEFRALKPGDDSKAAFLEYKPDIFFTSLGPLPLKYLDLALLKLAKKNGLKVFVNIPFWNSPISKLRISETPSIKDNKEYVELLNSPDFGDIYFNICEQGDDRMAGMEKMTGQIPKTLLLAADTKVIFPEKSKKFRADISYVGTYLPEKRDFFQQTIFPLKNTYDVRLYGQDWTFFDRNLGLVQKIGQYFDIPILRSLRKPKLELSDERKIYNSSLISLNVHETYQREYGDLNERTFKIPAAGGFEIVDNVSTLRKYFLDDEMVCAESLQDWKEKIAYYVENPDERESFIKKARNKVLKYHTYSNRVDTVLKWYKEL